jgi:hypothetical protein
MANFTVVAIEECRKRFEAGEAKALLDALDYCARSGSAMPVWLVEAFCACYGKWLRYDVKTLDQAFGVERKGERVSNRKFRESLKALVALEVSRLHRQEKLPIDEALFERVGKKFKIPMGMARDIYYKDNPWRQLFEAMPPESYSE